MAIKTISFNRRSINAIVPPQSGRDEYKDEKITGLRFRMPPSGLGVYSYLKRSDEGPVERITIGPSSRWTPERARKYAKTLGADFDAGRNPARDRRSLKSSATLRMLAECYFADRSAKKANPRSDRQMFTQWLTNDPISTSGRGRKPKGRGLNLADRRVLTLRHDDYRDLHQAVSKVSPVRANRVIALLSAMFEYGREEKLWLADNPIKGIKKNAEIKRKRFLQPVEVPRFLKALNEEADTLLKHFVMLSLLTGGRRSNVLTMRWDEIDIDAGLWTIPGPKFKNREEQEVPLVPEVIELLRQRRETVNETEPWVFPAKTKTGHLQSPDHGYARLLARAGISGLRLHGLRRSQGSWQARQGASLLIIGKSLGHRSSASTAIYAQLDNDPVRASMMRATSALLALDPMRRDESLRDRAAARRMRLDWTRVRSNR